MNITTRIRAITTQGREGGNERVERYKINYALNRTNRYSWKWLSNENGLSKVRSVDMPGMVYLIIKTFIDFALVTSMMVLIRKKSLLQGKTVQHLLST